MYDGKIRIAALLSAYKGNPREKDSTGLVVTTLNCLQLSRRPETDYSCIISQENVFDVVCIIYNPCVGLLRYNIKIRIAL